MMGTAICQKLRAVKIEVPSYFDSMTIIWEGWVTRPLTTNHIHESVSQSAGYYGIVSLDHNSK